jgi:hypothetical protein
MSGHGQQKQGGVKQDLTTIVGIAQCIAKVLEAWLRIPGTCGPRYFGGQALIGWIILLLAATFLRSQPLLDFWMVTGGVFLLQRLAHESRRRKGYHPHSRFIGVSFFHVLGGDRLAVRLWEPLFTVLVGVALMKNGDSYGTFVILLGVCLWISASYLGASEQARITAIEDAQIEQEWLVQQTRRHE